MPKKKELEKTESEKNIVYSPEEMAYRNYLIKRLLSAKNQRDKAHDELDGQTYLEYYESNAKKANSYIRPKVNDGDTRIVTGTTEEKNVSLLSALLNYNLEPNVEAYDDSDFLVFELGEIMEDFIKKSRKIEDYDSIRTLIYKEMLDQGTVFCEEQWKQSAYFKKDLKDINWSERVSPDKIKWDKRFENLGGKCEVNLLLGPNVYLGNVKEFMVSKQPYLFTVDLVPYAEAESIYKNWERWDYVPRKATSATVTDDYGQTIYTDFTLQKVEEDMVEIIKYQDKWANDFMIMLNGVMMLPIGFPLSAISPNGEYTIAKGDISPLGKFFAYSRSIPAKTKVDQEVLDEILRLIILENQKSFKPPLANNTNRILSRKIFLPGTITPGINVKDIQPISEAKGVTQAQFATFELIKKIIDQKTVSPVFTGEGEKGTQTATEIIELKRQSMMKLGLVVWGISNLERHLAYLRLNNIVEYWTKPVDQKIDKFKNQLVNIYRRVTVDSVDEEGLGVKKVIEFQPSITKTSEQVMAEEEIMSWGGQRYRKIYLDPEMFRQMKFNWYITITPTEGNNDELNRVLFNRAIAEGFALFTPQAFNLDYLKERWAMYNKQDPKKLFSQGRMMAGLGQMLPSGAGGENMGQVGAKGTKPMSPLTLGGQMGGGMARTIKIPEEPRAIGLTKIARGTK
jgi:hypothetical protein